MVRKPKHDAAKYDSEAAFLGLLLGAAIVTAIGLGAAILAALVQGTF